jgi:hypothetical protein
MKFHVTTVSIDRQTRQQHAPPRTELIDTDTNELFKDAATPLDIERRYEAVWNEPAYDLSGDGLADTYQLKVIGVDVVSEGVEAWTAEGAQAHELNLHALKLAVQRELLTRVAGRIADKVEQARNPMSGKMVW